MGKRVMFLLGMTMLPMWGFCATQDEVIAEGCAQVVRLVGYVVVGLGVCSLACAVGTLLWEAGQRWRLKPLTSEGCATVRTANGRPKEMTPEERCRVEARVRYLEARLVEGVGFVTRTDVVLACSELAECRLIAPTDTTLIGRINMLSSAAREGLGRSYILWKSGFGKALLVGGMVLSVVLCFVWPILVPLTLVPLTLYAVLGLTPRVVALNPGGLDGFASVAVFVVFGGALGAASEIGSYTETVWVERYSGLVRHREIDCSPTGIAIVLTILVLALTAIFLFVRMEILFVRNFLVYR